MMYTIICSDPDHSVFPNLQQLVVRLGHLAEIRLVTSSAEIDWQGKYLFLVACTEFTTKSIRDRFAETIVFHASDLPVGRGWSPYIWEIEAGAQYVTMSVLRASKHIDAGEVFLKSRIDVPENAVYDEILALINGEIVSLIEGAITRDGLPEAVPQDQKIEPTYYRRRTPEDSHISATTSLERQFDRIRVCDPHRFPPVCQIRGRWYKVILQPVDDRDIIQE